MAGHSIWANLTKHRARDDDAEQGIESNHGQANGFTDAITGSGRMSFIVYTLGFSLALYVGLAVFDSIVPTLGGFLDFFTKAFVFIGLFSLYLYTSVLLFSGQQMGDRLRQIFLQILESLKHQRTDFFLYFVLLGLSLISFISTSFGLVQLMSDGEPIAEHASELRKVSSLIPFILSLSVQLFILVSVSRFADPRTAYKEKAYFALIYLLLLLFSSGFGYGFWYDKIFAKSEYYNNVENASTRFLQTVLLNNSRIDGAISVAQQVYLQAEESYKLEEQVGGQCHPRVGSGKGLRQDYLKVSRDRVKAVYDDLVALRERMPTAAGVEKALAGIGAEANPSAAIVGIRRYADALNIHYRSASSHIDNFKAVFSNLVNEGRAIVPEDLEVAALKGTDQEKCPLDTKRSYLRLVDGVTADITISKEDYFVVDYEDKREVLITAFSRFANLLLDLLTGAIDFSAEGSDLRQVLKQLTPFGLNVFIDLLIFLLAFSLGSKGLQTTPSATTADDSE